jgi:hypothetical protein
VLFWLFERKKEEKKKKKRVQCPNITIIAFQHVKKQLNATTLGIPLGIRFLAITRSRKGLLMVTARALRQQLIRPTCACESAVATS